MIRLLTVLLAATLAATGCNKPPPTSSKPEVQVITLEATNVPVYEEWIGTLDGSVNAQIRAQATGYLLAQKYAEGGRVKKGDVLFEIDPRPFQAALEQAEAKLAQDQAQLGKTGLDVKRYTPLAKMQAMSQEELDNAVQANLAAAAQVKADQAALDLAAVNLGFTKISSPVDGLAGMANAQIGDLVGMPGGLLTTVSTVDPIKVYFSVNEQSYLDFWQKFIGPAGTNSAEKPPELRLILGDGSSYPEAGTFFFADRQVNINTGTLQITGLFPNHDYLLRPGQYGRVRALTRVKRGVFLVPQRALTELQGSYQVTVVESVDGKTKARLKTVKVGDRAGSNWIIESGLAPGDRLVVEGLQKAKDGIEVAVKPFVPTPQTNNVSGKP